MSTKTLSSRIKSQVKSLVLESPVIGDRLLRKFLQEHFGAEIDLIQDKPQKDSSHPSIFHFSMNKAATQHVRELLIRCAGENNITSIGLAEYAFHTNFPYLDALSFNEMEKYQYLFRPTGYLYSCFGGFIEGIPNLEKYLVVLMIRDPRDVLVSEYFSYAFSHSEPSKRGSKYMDFMKKRRQALHSTIDEYALTECDRVHNIYQKYINLLLDHYTNVLTTKYEEMTSDYSVWLKALLKFCKLEISPSLLADLLEKAKYTRPKEENKYEHNRKGTPGDYMEKLQQETIEALNTKLSPILKRFDYI